MKSNQTTKLLAGIPIVLLLIAGYFVLKLNGISIGGFGSGSQSINLWTIFLTGLLTGGLSCLAVQGGLLASTIAQREEEKLKNKTKQSGNASPIFVFLIAKLVAYTILGFLLGWFGSFFQLSITTQVIMQFVVAVFMIGTALNILNAHPIFRYFAIQPPKSVMRLIKNQSKSKSLFAPLVLGAFTVFIPCGTTQAMMALAIGSGSAFLGSAVLFSFVLGTSPIFFILGYFATKLGDSMHQKFMKGAAIALILLALFNLKNAFALTGNTLGIKSETTVSQIQEVTNETTITFTASSYSPNAITVKKGSNVKLHLINKDGYSCIQAFTIPKLGIQKIVAPGSSDVVEFTAPSTPGPLAFMCSMGMYRGTINVI